MEWSSKDLIEEELLKNATAETICGWLKTNADKNFWELDSNFPNLREKYEPIWSTDENDALKMSVCLYGQDFKTLRSLFYSELPNHFKVAILQNPAFVRNAGLYFGQGRHYLVEADILELYEKYKKSRKDSWFINLFNNPALPEEFITRIFRRQKPYQNISEKHLLEIFEEMFLLEKGNYLYKNILKYKAYDGTKSEGRHLANEIIKFIPEIRRISKYKKNEFCSPYIASCIQNFLENSKDLDTYGISDEKTLLTFCDKLDNAELSSDDEQLIWIQMELGRRAFSGVFRNGNKDQLLVLGKSNYAQIRSIYYQYCDLGEFYNLPNWKLEEFFKNTPTSCIDWAVWGEGEPPDPISNEYRIALKALAEFLKREKHLAAALALNENHYTSKEARAFLKEICRQADIIGNTFSWPLGNGKCIDVFKAKCESLKNEHPEYFNDAIPERLILESAERLTEMLFDVRSSFDKHTNQQSDIIKINASQFDLINQKLNDQQHRLDQIDHKVCALTMNLSGKFKGPASSRLGFLFSTPIIGSILRVFFK